MLIPIRKATINFKQWHLYCPELVQLEVSGTWRGRAMIAIPRCYRMKRSVHVTWQTFSILFGKEHMGNNVV
jgi:hypothetical protein